MGDRHHFIFGVFKKGQLIKALNTTTCTHAVAAFIIDLLDAAVQSLPEGGLPGGCYFAYDYWTLTKERNAARLQK
jgi:hypothetical protein